MKHFCTAFLTFILINGSLIAQEPNSSEALGGYILPANPGPANNGGSAGWAIFFDLIAGPYEINITDMTTASTATAGTGFSVEFFTRSGTALGGPVGSGPGSSPAGWTSLGSVPVTQGGTSSGISLLFATPLIVVNPGDTVGVAVQFSTVGPRYFGTGTPPYSVYADTNLTLITGDGRSVPFTPTGTFFASRALVGEIHYDAIIPVELTSFSALVNLNDVTLIWETATEINNSGFSVERKEFSEFETVGFVPGFGTTTEPKSYSFTDSDLQPGVYHYRLKQIDYDGTFEYSDVIEIEVVAPFEYLLQQNYPNPFNPSTTISFSLAMDSKINLKIFDLLGQEVAQLLNSDLTTGSHKVTFDAVSLNSGIYFYKLVATGIDGTEFTDVKKMTLTK